MERRQLLLRLGTLASRAGVSLRPVWNGTGETATSYALDGLLLPVPRDRDVNDLTSQAILRQAARHLAQTPNTNTRNFRASNFAATATRSGEWWALEAKDVGRRPVFTQCRRLDQAEAALRRAIALVLDINDDINDDSFEVDVRTILPEGLVSPMAARVIAARQTLAAGEASIPATVQELRAAGLTVRDVGALLGLTAPRVSQIDRSTA